MIKVRIAVCDDQVEFQNVILSNLERYKDKYDIDVSTYSSGEELIEVIMNNCFFHTIFLDIQIKGINGIKTAEEIRKYDSRVNIIFVTSYADYAVEGYEVSALHYILKPITSEKFDAVFSKALSNWEYMNNKISIKVGIKIVLLDVSSILYIESQGREVYFYTKETSYRTYSSFSKEHKRLEKFDFVQPHRCYSVNLAYIKAIEKDRVILSDDRSIPLSRDKYRYFYSKYANYILR